MKLVNTVLSILLAASLRACSGKEEPAPAAASAAPVSETAAPAGPKVVEPAYGRGDGAMGDTMKTAYLEFTLNSARLVPSWQTILPDAGMKLLVLNITTKSTQTPDLTLYDTDYQVQWGGTGPEDYSTPLTYRDEWATAPTYKRTVNLDGVEGMFPGTAVLRKDESLSADYIYQVPEGYSDFKLEFQEFFEDESLGGFFCVTFHADPETE